MIDEISFTLVFVVHFGLAGGIALVENLDGSCTVCVKIDLLVFGGDYSGESYSLQFSLCCILSTGKIP